MSTVKRPDGRRYRPSESVLGKVPVLIVSGRLSHSRTANLLKQAHQLNTFVTHCRSDRNLQVSHPTEKTPITREGEQADQLSQSDKQPLAG